MDGSRDEQGEMHRQVSWLTRADVTILEFLHAARDVRGNPSEQSPKTIGANTGHPRQYVSERFREGQLLERDLVEKTDHGLYRLTERGEKLMSGKIKPEDL